MSAVNGYSRALRVTGLVLLAFAAGATTAFADSLVFKWLDGDGRVHYSDRPPEGDVKVVSVETLYEHTRAGTNNANAAPAQRPASAPPGPASAADPALKKQVAADVAKVSSEQCKQARDRYDAYVRSRHIYKEGDNKERVYLSDAEIEEARINAKRDVDEACAAAQ